MRYLEEGPFKTFSGCPFKMTNPKGRNENERKDSATNSDLLHYLLSSYNPMPSESFVLDVGGLRRLNKVINILEEPPKNNWFALEDADFKTAEIVAVKMATFLIPRNAPAIEDLLKSAKEELPTSEERGK